MRKIFEYIGLITLMCFSFFITEKTTLVVQNVDDIMIEIRNNSKIYESDFKNSSIDGDDIIPGVCGKKVNITKSYSEMKKIGMFDPSFYVYDNIKPKISLSKNFNKFIIAGNSNKNYIYFFIELNESNKKYLSNYEFKNFNFIVNYSFFTNNTKLISSIIKNNNSILLINSDYKEYKQINKEYVNKKNSNIYCYNPEKNNEFLDVCSNNESYTIRVDNIVKNNEFLNIKKFIKRGNFIKVDLNNLLIKNIGTINDYILSKGIELSNVDDSIREC